MRKTKKVKDLDFDDREEYPLRIIEWIDIHSVGDSWQGIEDVDLSFPHIKSVGFVVHEDEDRVLLVQTISTDEEIIGELVIPKSTIVGDKKLK